MVEGRTILTRRNGTKGPFCEGPTGAAKLPYGCGFLDNGKGYLRGLATKHTTVPSRK